ncbi:MAG: hypothetical protein N2517_00710 [Ignavibacteria bacterium]|nr:hypothetical protein [Ignavibacteria bacterium]
MNFSSRTILYYAMLLFALLSSSCQQIRNITHKLGSFTALRFKIESITQFSLAGINLATKSSLNDFTAVDALKIGQEIAGNRLPVSFVINVAVKNPNTGFGGTKPIPVKLSQFKWTLFIDGIQTVSGGLAKEYHFPSSSEPSHLPLEVKMDLFQFFGNRGYEGLMNLALKLGGFNSNPSIITIEAEPTFSTPFGDFQSPKIKITSESFN